MKQKKEKDYLDEIGKPCLFPKVEEICSFCKTNRAKEGVCWLSVTGERRVVCSFCLRHFKKEVKALKKSSKNFFGQEITKDKYFDEERIYNFFENN